MPRIELLSPPYTPEQEARITPYSTRGSAVSPLAIFRAFASHPALQDATKSLGRFHLVPEPPRSATLSQRDREIVIDRVCARCDCEYEWGVHVTTFAYRVGLTPAQVTATVRGGSDDPAWPPRDQLLIRLVDELHDTAALSDDLWRALAAEWQQAQILELLILTGWYHSVAYLVNGVRLDPEPWAARFPQA